MNTFAIYAHSFHNQVILLSYSVIGTTLCNGGLIQASIATKPHVALQSFHGHLTFSSLMMAMSTVLTVDVVGLSVITVAQYWMHMMIKY